MEVKELKELGYNKLYQRVLECIKEAGNSSADDDEKCFNNGSVAFIWRDTKEGSEFWRYVYGQKFEEAFELSPEYREDDKPKGLKLWEIFKALDEGKYMQYLDKNNVWKDSCFSFSSSVLEEFQRGKVFRIKPEIEVKEFPITIENETIYSMFDDDSSHKITIEFKDGEPICESIRMEKL